MADVKDVQSVDDFNEVVEQIREMKDFPDPMYYGFGVGTYQDGRLLSAWFPVVNGPEDNTGMAALAWYFSDHLKASAVMGDNEIKEMLMALLPFKDDGKDHPNIDALLLARECSGETTEFGTKLKPVRVILTDLNTPPTDAADVYFRLHLLSHRKVQPHGVNLDGMFGLLENVAWTNEGPVLASEINRVRLTMGRQLYVRLVDKIPHMADFVVPSGVRIANTAQVRLGAYLGEGTTVMPTGFVNFNAGSTGTSMIEGRVSAGVVLGNGTDLGGGCSTMGTLSGGGEEVISIGEGCLIGANAGTGISLGDNCVIEAGCYITAGAKVHLPDGEAVKALELSGQRDLLFRRNSVNGSVEALARSGQKIELNADLHAN